MSDYTNRAVTHRSLLGPFLLIGGGIAAGVGAWFAFKKSGDTTEAIQKAIAGQAPPAQPAEPQESTPDSPQLQPPVEAGTGGYVDLRTTGYWPYSARSDEKKMEGGTVGAAAWRGKRVVDPATGKRIVLTTVEMYRADPVGHPFVSLSGDPDVWPWGQKIVIPWTDGGSIVGRVVDTGSHFHGINKIFRAVGYEPIDVCVQSSQSKVPTKVTAQIVAGDNWDKGNDVATSKIKNQNVSLAGIVEGRTTDDHDALARALESELGDRTVEEMLGAAWAIRNRAGENNVSVADLLAPKKRFGSPAISGGYASTRKAATDRSKKIANVVLGAADEHDPTGGAIDFWSPEQQQRLNQLGDVHRAASAAGDMKKAQKYARYAQYGTEGDVRMRQAANGLQVRSVVGIIELLGRM